MVSKAREDLPDPDGPVTTMNARRGISRSKFLRLCCRAPLMTMLSFTNPIYIRGWSCAEQIPTWTGSRYPLADPRLQISETANSELGRSRTSVIVIGQRV